jgi:hypothetical protein
MSSARCFVATEPAKDKRLPLLMACFDRSVFALPRPKMQKNEYFTFSYQIWTFKQREGGEREGEGKLIRSLVKWKYMNGSSQLKAGDTTEKSVGVGDWRDQA